MNAKKFKNFSSENFSWKFNGVEYTFSAGQEIFLEEDKANHFAKHLIDRELNRLNIATNYIPKRQELEALCFPSDETITPLEALQITETKKRKPKKVVEEEFEDLKETPKVTKKKK